MTPRTIHIGTSFFAVVAAFWTYMLLAVPFIEPASKPVIIDITRDPNDYPDGQRIGFESLFSPDAWELHEPKVINIDSARILWQKYTTLNDGWVELTPVTMIFLPDDSTLDMAERIRSAVVMEVPAGAKLRFDPPLVLGHAKEMHLVEGKLLGKVTIRSRGKPGSNQGDLHIETSDVLLTEQRIWTPNKVDFRWGLHYGSGRQMEIKLLPRQGPAAAGQSGPNVGGIEECDFQTIERLHLDLSHVDNNKAIPGGAAAAGAKPAIGQPVMPFFRGPSNSAGPLEITCRGPFHFNLVQQMATFKDQVDVFRVQPTGPSDHLSCEQLSVFFTHASGTAATSSSPPGSSGPGGFDLQPQRMEAIGTPAVITAPAEQVMARGEHLSYDVASGAMVLDGGQEVTLKKENNEIHARNLHYTPSKEPGRLGTIISQGPGTLHAQMTDRPGQILDARWNDYLKVLPKNLDDIVSLTGGASLNFQAMGRLDAKEIYFWLKECPPPPGGKQNELQPDRLLAQGAVRGDSPQLSTSVDRMEVWFTMQPPPATPMLAGGGPNQPPPPNNGLGSAPGQNTGLPGQRFEPAGTAPPPAQQPQRHMDIAGRLLQAKVTMRDREHGELTEATVVDNVVLRETQTAVPGEQPLLVTGQRLAATDANGPTAKVIVIGEPAHMEGHKLSLTGPVIELDKGANSLIMHGPGEMQMPIDRDMAGKPLAVPQPLQVDWQTKMTFDGLTAEFDDGVVARTTSQLLETRLLKLRLQNKVSFSGAQSTPGAASPEAKPEMIWCDGGAYLENRGLDAAQQVQTSLDRMKLNHLDVNFMGGDIHGTGPGWMIHVGRGESGGMMAPASLGGGMNVRRTSIPAGTFVGRTSSPSRSSMDGLEVHPTNDPALMTCMHLKFLGDMTGNINRKEVTFSKQVRVAYNPVPTWRSTLESDDPQQLGPNAVVLHCDNLSVVDLGANGQAARGGFGLAGSSSGSAELLADGNVVAEGTEFTVRSARMTYSKQKEQLIFAGDGRTDAEIFLQKHEGAEPMHTSAQKIIYSRRNRQWDVDGARSFDMNELQERQLRELRGAQ